MRKELKSLFGIGMLSVASFVNDVDSAEIVLPKVGKVDTSDKIISNGHFTWGEATRNGTRIPNKAEIVDNIIETAKYMEEIREYLGNRPIIITSWYRDPQTNDGVGGAKYSLHMYGKGVDFRVKGMSQRETYQKLESYWDKRGGLGCYKNWTHIDNRGKKARWIGR